VVITSTTDNSYKHFLNIFYIVPTIALEDLLKSKKYKNWIILYKIKITKNFEEQLLDFLYKAKKYREIEKKKLELSVTKNFSWQFVKISIINVSLKS
jgi:hypothetical protein